MALQEISRIENPAAMKLPRFQALLFKSRDFAKGGGTGLYIREGLSCKEVKEYSIFIERVFESICYEVDFGSNGKILFLSLKLIFGQALDILEWQSLLDLNNGPKIEKIIPDKFEEYFNPNIL